MKLYQSSEVVCACGCHAPRVTAAFSEGLAEYAARGLAAQGWVDGTCPTCCGRPPDTRPIGERIAAVVAGVRGTP